MWRLSFGAAPVESPAAPPLTLILPASLTSSVLVICGSAPPPTADGCQGQPEGPPTQPEGPPPNLSPWWSCCLLPDLGCKNTPPKFGCSRRSSGRREPGTSFCGGITPQRGSVTAEMLDSVPAAPQNMTRYTC